MRRFIKIIALLVVIVAAVPMALSVVYAVVNPPSVPILKRELRGEPVDQTWVRLEDVAPALAQAVIMSEDARFCLHWGVDLRQLQIVITEALEGSDRPRGASTITMQVVKNLFLWPQRNYLRKIVEIPLALWMDLVLSKDRILEIYLNVAQWGPGIYGIEAAAQKNYGIDASALSRQRAVALATMLPAPSARNPRNPGRRQRAAMAHVERELDRAPWVFTCLPSGFRPG